MMQSSNIVVMVRPGTFRLNEETMVNNVYQNASQAISPEEDLQKAQEEFDALVNVLKVENVRVAVVQDTDIADTPDAIFPNNWISFHEGGEESSIIIYPLFAVNRRRERLNFTNIKELLIKDYLFPLDTYKFIDFTASENENDTDTASFLEGTGSLVLDRIHRIAYAALSPRTDVNLVLKWCDDFQYKPMAFTAMQTLTLTMERIGTYANNSREEKENEKENRIYHTNVMLAIGTSWAVLCKECIPNDAEQADVIASLEATHEIVYISKEQVNCFCGNLLELRSGSDCKDGDASTSTSTETSTAASLIIAMSSTAFTNFTFEQKAILSKHAKLVHSAIPTVEVLGGGSVRCMLLEVFGAASTSTGTGTG
jgi:hypothetical protein